MGKEKKDANLFKMGRFMYKPMQYNRKERQELAKDWANTQSITLKEHITENGKVTVNIKSHCIDITAVCNGMRNEGNKFEDLAMLLRRQNMILDNEKITAFYIFKGYTWSQVSITEECFRSGDRVLITLEETSLTRKKAVHKASLSIKKAIKKPLL